MTFRANRSSASLTFCVRPEDLQSVQRSSTTCLSSVDHIANMYIPGTSVYLKRFQIGIKFVESSDPAAFAAAIDDKTKAIYVESIGNPKYNVAPLPELAKVGLILVDLARTKD